MSYIQKLYKKGLIKNIPEFIVVNTQYETIMGSHAYGVEDTSEKTISDFDVYGFCLPNKEILFPHLAGYIEGFSKSSDNFKNWQQHHIIDKEDRREYDFDIYNISRYFQLCMENNPNMIDSLFTPQRCILHCTKIGTMVREKRKIFLHKGCWHKFKGYAFSQLHKMRIKHGDAKYLFDIEQEFDDKLLIKDIEDWINNGKDKTHEISEYSRTMPYYIELLERYLKSNPTEREQSVRQYGIDRKFAYHIIRLLGECEQILLEHDLDLERQDRREVMKSVRRGEWSFEQILDWFQSKEKQLDQLYHDSTLQYSPDHEKIRQLLIDCIEEHYGSVSNILNTGAVKNINIFHELDKITESLHIIRNGLI